ncbi:hypothetical protein ACP70R_002288 [Stipagrostis hirtigluma subsp. patula]
MNHRRFLHLVMWCSCALYSINHLDTSHLFYKSAAAAAKRNGSKQGIGIGGIPALRRLPPPSFSFQAFRSEHSSLITGADVFAPFGEGKILCADEAVHYQVCRCN